MKLDTKHSNVQSGGMNLEVHYKIEANRKSFDVLSGDMYSHIVSTIVRELSSNAFDAHLEAEKRGEVGQGSVPFTVGCPTAFDPYFTVNDEGTGLRYYKFSAKIRNDASDDIEGDITSTIFIDGDIRDNVADIDTLILTQNGNSKTVAVPSYLYDKTKDVTCLRINGEYHGDNVTVEFDDCLVLYSTYFKSTKEETNDYIGGYGLGAKTPLAYTDNFMVTNRFEGTERVYSIYKNEDGMPCINLMGSVPTAKHDGMEVKMGVSSDDYVDFKDAIEDQLKFFVPQPTILNDVVVMPQILHTGTHFLLMDTDNRDEGYGYHRKAGTSVGFNAYNIKHVNNSLFSEKLALRFAIGEVKVTASREELKYDDATIEMIQKREADAMEEYREYILDTIDTTGMEDYEKAAFLNTNHAVLDLSSDKIKELVDNPHYQYGKRDIKIPITGWGDYTQLVYTDDFKRKLDPVTGDIMRDVDGIIITEKTGTTLKTNMCHTSRALKWSSYNQRQNKTGKMNVDQTISPTQDLMVFIRDNSFSFLKKIAWYCEENDIDGDDSSILILDLFSDVNTSSASLKILKSLIDHTATFVRLSDITLPKNISLTPINGYTTPTARLFVRGNHNFRNPKYWSDVYTPLTKIDTDAYVIQTHRGDIEDLSWNDQCFLTEYLKSGYEWDDDEINILVLSRARYEKAIKYGFKPMSDLVTELKSRVKIPVDVVHADLMGDLLYKINELKIMDMIQYCSPKHLNQISKSSNITTLLRVQNIIEKRYESKSDEYSGMESISEYMDDTIMPESMKSVTKMIDTISKLCDTMKTGYILLINQNSWYFKDNEKKQALVDYINFIESQEIEEDE
jgi:hypothetical protein